MAKVPVKRWRVEFVQLLCNPDGSRSARSLRTEWVMAVSAVNAERLARRRTGYSSLPQDVGGGVIEWVDADVMEVA